MSCNFKNVDHNWVLIKKYYWEEKLADVLILQCSTAATENFQIHLFGDQMKDQETFDFITEFFSLECRTYRIVEDTMSILTKDVYILPLATRKPQNASVSTPV